LLEILLVGLNIYLTMGEHSTAYTDLIVSKKKTTHFSDINMSSPSLPMVPQWLKLAFGVKRAKNEAKTFTKSIGHMTHYVLLHISNVDKVT
jgi:hypothetical protein